MKLILVQVGVLCSFITNSFALERGAKVITTNDFIQFVYQVNGKEQKSKKWYFKGLPFNNSYSRVNAEVKSVKKSGVYEYADYIFSVDETNPKLVSKKSLARAACIKQGKDLPTKEDFIELMSFFDNSGPFDPNNWNFIKKGKNGIDAFNAIFKESKNKSYWTSSLGSKNEFSWVFDTRGSGIAGAFLAVAPGRISLSTFSESVMCVGL